MFGSESRRSLCCIIQSACFFNGVLVVLHCFRSRSPQLLIIRIYVIFYHIYSFVSGMVTFSGNNSFILFLCFANTIISSFHHLFIFIYFHHGFFSIEHPASVLSSSSNWDSFCTSGAGTGHSVRILVSRALLALICLPYLVASNRLYCRHCGHGNSFGSNFLIPQWFGVNVNQSYHWWLSCRKQFGATALMV